MRKFIIDCSTHYIHSISKKTAFILDEQLSEFFPQRVLLRFSKPLQGFFPYLSALLPSLEPPSKFHRQGRIPHRAPIQLHVLILSFLHNRHTRSQIQSQKKSVC